MASVTLETSSKNYIRFALRALFNEKDCRIVFNESGVELICRGCIFDNQLYNVKKIGFRLLYFSATHKGDLKVTLVFTDKLEKFMDKDFDDEGNEVEKNE